jgi:hypothetical protein
MITATAILTETIVVTASLGGNVCQPATYTLVDEDANVLDTGSIISGGAETIIAPDGTVLRDGLPYGSVLSGGTIDVLSDPCLDATVENSDVTFTQDIVSGATYVLYDYEFEFQDPDGVVISTEIVPAMSASTFNFPTGFGADAILQRNGTQIKTIASGATFNLITKLDGAANNGTWDGVDTLDFTSDCPPIPSVSLAVSDTTPDVGQVITLTATPTNITPTGYTFFTYDGVTIQLIIQQAGAVYNWTVNRSGSYDVYVMASDGTDSVSDFVPIVATQTYLAVTTNYMNAVGIPDNGSASIYGVTNNACWVAWENFFQTLTTNSLLSKHYYIRGMMGSAATAANYKFNAINPLDTDAAYRATYSGGVTFSALGTQGNGSNGYADSKFNDTAAGVTRTDFGITMYSRTDSTASGVDMGIAGLSWVWLWIKQSASVDFAGIYDDANFNGNYAANSKGVFSVNRDPSEANRQRLYRNGANIGTRSGHAVQPLNNLSIFEMARNIGVPATYSSRQYTYFAAHTGMTAAQTAIYHTAIETLQTALNRQA